MPSGSAGAQAIPLLLFGRSQDRSRLAPLRLLWDDFSSPSYGFIERRPPAGLRPAASIHRVPRTPFWLLKAMVPGGEALWLRSVFSDAILFTRVGMIRSAGLVKEGGEGRTGAAMASESGRRAGSEGIRLQTGDQETRARLKGARQESASRGRCASVKSDL